MSECATGIQAGKQPKIETAWDALFFTFDRNLPEGARASREEAQLRAALRRERLLGRSGHRSYSLTRHMALSRRLRDVLARRMVRGGSGLGATQAASPRPA